MEHNEEQKLTFKDAVMILYLSGKLIFKGCWPVRFIMDRFANAKGFALYRLGLCKDTEELQNLILKIDNSPDTSWTVSEQELLDTRLEAIRNLALAYNVHINFNSKDETK